MESNLLVEKNVYFHGIWKAGYRVSDKLINSIANDIESKPSRLLTLRLTTEGLTVEASHDETTKKRNQVAFSSLRDISVNKYQRACLLIIYVDSNSTFSIMACSHQEESELEEISNAFRQQKNALLKSGQAENRVPASANWTLRQTQKLPQEGSAAFVRENYVRSGLSNGIGHAKVNKDIVMPKETSGGSQRSNTNVSVRSSVMDDYNNDEEVFGVSRTVLVHEPEDVKRVAVEGGHHGRSDAFSVEVQTTPYEEEFDLESITSAVSQMSSFKGEVQGTNDDSSLSPNATSSEISAEQYFQFENTQGNSIMKEVHHLFSELTTDVTHTEGGTPVGRDPRTANEERTEHGSHHLLAANGNDRDKLATYHRRSLATQTMNNSKMGRRYAKKNMSRSSSNSYKEKVEALRKKSTGPKSPTSVGFNSAGNPGLPSPTARSPATSGTKQHRSSVADSNTSQTVKRTTSIGSTTVLKPIESVYAGWSTRRANSARGQRPINLIIYSPTSPNHTT